MKVNLVQINLTIFRYLIAELKCPTKEKLSKLANFLVESIDRVERCCPGALIGEGGTKISPAAVSDDILRIARGEDPSSKMCPNSVFSSSSSSSSSSPLHQHWYVTIYSKTKNKCL